MQAPKFEPGTTVQPIGRPVDAGEIVSFSFTPANGYMYQVTSKEWDGETKTVINGVRHCSEAELELFTAPVEASATAE